MTSAAIMDILLPGCRPQIKLQTAYRRLAASHTLHSTMLSTPIASLHDVATLPRATNSTPALTSHPNALVCVGKRMSQWKDWNNSVKTQGGWSVWKRRRRSGGLPCTSESTVLPWRQGPRHFWSVTGRVVLVDVHLELETAEQHLRQSKTVASTTVTLRAGAVGGIKCLCRVLGGVGSQHRWP